MKRSTLGKAGGTVPAAKTEKAARRKSPNARRALRASDRPNQGKRARSGVVGSNRWGEYERLSASQERKLVLAADKGDREARRQLVEAFMPLIAGVARIYRGSRAVERMELMQEGVVGLLRALERYDPRRGTPFWAYASWWVRQAMQDLVAELSRPVVLSDRALRKLARIKDARREYVQAHKKEPSTAELATKTALPSDQVEKLIVAERTPRAFEGPLGDDENTDATLGDLLADPLGEDEYERVDRRIEVEELRSLPSELCERERLILKARYGLDCPEQTLRELAGGLQLSAERVRQIEERALEKLRLAACA
jgi:RNA polymerase primary sigma factor